MESTSGNKSNNGNSLKQGGEALSNTAKAFVDEAKDKGLSMRDEAVDAGKKFGAHVATTLEGVVSKVGEEVSGIASSILPSEGTLRDATSKVVDGIKAGSEYIQQKSMKDMQQDLTHAVRSYPFGFMLAGIAVGYLIGTSCKSKQ